jgi:hypothetical protein
MKIKSKIRGGGTGGRGCGGGGTIPYPRAPKK